MTDCEKCIYFQGWERYCMMNFFLNNNLSKCDYYKTILSDYLEKFEFHLMELQDLLKKMKKND